MCSMYSKRCKTELLKVLDRGVSDVEVCERVWCVFRKSWQEVIAISKLPQIVIVFLMINYAQHSLT